jgi:hypothetical protein
MQAVKRSSARLVEQEVFMCPVPCSYRYDLWIWLFAISVALNVVFGASVLPGVIREMRHARKHSAFK